jgi:RND family efflux transporter MFP subunit
MKICSLGFLSLSIFMFAVPARTGEGVTEFQAVLRPARTVAISSASVGILAEVNVDRGDRVTPGQVLAVLDSQVERADLAVIRARAESQTSIEIAETQLVRIRTRFEQAEDLFEERIMSSEELEQFRTELQIAELNLRKAREDQVQGQLELKRAEVRLAQRTVRSSIDGVVVERYLSPGELVDRSDNSVIVELAQLDPLFIDVRVPQSMLARLERGDKAVVQPELLTEELECSVLTIDPVVDAATGSLRVRLSLPNPSLDIPAGLRCTVRFLE